MNPGSSPIFKNPRTGQDTNVPPSGNNPWKPPLYVLAQYPDEDPVPINLRLQGNPV